MDRLNQHDNADHRAVNDLTVVQALAQSVHLRRRLGIGTRTLEAATWCSETRRRVADRLRTYESEGE